MRLGTHGKIFDFQPTTGTPVKAKIMHRWVDCGHVSNV